MQGHDRRFDLRRPKYTRNPRELSTAQGFDLIEQTHRANGTWEDYQAQQIADRQSWMDMAKFRWVDTLPNALR